MYSQGNLLSFCGRTILCHVMMTMMYSLTVWSTTTRPRTPKLHSNSIGLFVYWQFIIALKLHLFAVNAFSYEDELVWALPTTPRTALIFIDYLQKIPLVFWLVKSNVKKIWLVRSRGLVMVWYLVWLKRSLWSAQKAGYDFE